MINASNAYGVAHFAPTPHINNLKWDNIDVIGGMLDMINKERNYQLAQDTLELNKERLGLDRDTLDWNKDDAIAKRMHELDVLAKDHLNKKELAELQGKINLKVADKHNYAYSLMAKREQEALDRADKLDYMFGEINGFYENTKKPISVNETAAFLIDHLGMPIKKATSLAQKFQTLQRPLHKNVADNYIGNALNKVNGSGKSIKLR
jgi:hypothetical protein